jgi:hypothetical protein
MSTDPGISTAKCPFCVTAIPDGAVQCKSCGAWLRPEDWPTANPGLYPQPISRLIALSIATFGLYNIYWFYRSWRQVSECTGKRMSPGWRTVGLFVPILGLVFIYDLFDDMQKILALKGMRPTIRAGWLLLLLIGCTLCWRLSEPLDLLGLLAFLPLAIAQSDMNRLWVAIWPGTASEGMSALEIVILIVGGVLIMLVALGSLLPE